MADEEFYLQVENELKAGTKDEALWSKAKHLAKDDEKETEIQYTKLRVDQLTKKDAQLKVDSAVDGMKAVFTESVFRWLLVAVIVVAVIMLATGS